MADPRRNPKAGSVLRNGRYRFTVGSVDRHDRVHYTLIDTEARTSLGKTGMACDRSLASWREMMRDAEVVS
jgi:predicted alternative tryptophan synthase beta-subunit